MIEENKRMRDDIFMLVRDFFSENVDVLPPILPEPWIGPIHILRTLKNAYFQPRCCNPYILDSLRVRTNQLLYPLRMKNKFLP